MLSQPVVDALAAIQSDGVGVFRKVAGAANFAAALDDMKNHPAAYVIQLADAAKPNHLLGLAVEQHVIERFGVVLAVRNLRDVRGGAVNAELESIRNLVISTLMGFQPASGYDPAQYGGGRILKLDVATIWWQLEFITGYYHRSF